MKKDSWEKTEDEKKKREKKRERNPVPFPLREQNEKEWLSIIRCLNKLEPVLQARYGAAPHAAVA